jgi:hypothetical protein
VQYEIADVLPEPLRATVLDGLAKMHAAHTFCERDAAMAAMFDAALPAT